jgi:hypothetical protein
VLNDLQNAMHFVESAEGFYPHCPNYSCLLNSRRYHLKNHAILALNQYQSRQPLGLPEAFFLIAVQKTVHCLMNANALAQALR